MDLTWAWDRVWIGGIQVGKVDIWFDPIPFQAAGEPNCLDPECKAFWLTTVVTSLRPFLSYMPRSLIKKIMLTHHLVPS